MTLEEFLSAVKTDIVEPGVLLLFGIAFVIFFWGIVQYIKKADDVKGRAEGTQSILWGIVGMVIMISVYGIIRIAYGTIGGDPSDLPENKNEPYLPEGAVESPF